MRGRVTPEGSQGVGRGGQAVSCLSCEARSQSGWAWGHGTKGRRAAQGLSQATNSKSDQTVDLVLAGALWLQDLCRPMLHTKATSLLNSRARLCLLLLSKAIFVQKASSCPQWVPRSQAPGRRAEGFEVPVNPCVAHRPHSTCSCSRADLHSSPPSPNHVACISSVHWQHSQNNRL